MEPVTLKEKRKSMRVPVELTVLGEIDGQRLSMFTENISLEGLFLFSRDFVRPRAVFPARIWLSNEEEPIRVYLTACFIERTWTGYGIGVYISGISAEDTAVWDNFYRCCAATRAEQLRQQINSEKTVRNRRIVVVEGAISPLAMQALRKQGLDVASSPSVAEAVEDAQGEPPEAIICDLRRPGQDGLALCSQVHEKRIPTRTVLLTDSAGPREFILGLCAGANRVIAKPCSNDMLVARILEVLQQRLPPGRSTSAELGFSARPPDASLHVAAPSEVSQAYYGPLAAMESVTRSASERITKAYRFVTHQFARLQSL